MVMELGAVKSAESSSQGWPIPESHSGLESRDQINAHL
jgi:hypothetical protein